MNEMFSVALSIGLGLGLSAACGFRVFLPLLALSAGSYFKVFAVIESFSWVGTMPAMITLAVATVAEILAYYIPWFDHALDMAASPGAMIAGAVTTASTLVDVDPATRWSLAIIAGGGIAGTVQATTVLARGASTATTGGIANPIVSSIELGMAVLMSVLAVLVPMLAMFAIGFIVVMCIYLFMRKRWAKERAHTQ